MEHMSALTFAFPARTPDPFASMEQHLGILVKRGVERQRVAPGRTQPRHAHRGLIPNNPMCKMSVSTNKRGHYQAVCV